MLYLALILRILAMSGDGTVTFLYSQLKWGWTPYDFSYYITADNLIGLTGIGILSFIGMKVLKLQDTTVVVVGSASYVVGSFLYPFAQVGWIAYLGEFLSV